MRTLLSSSYQLRLGVVLRYYSLSFYKEVLGQTLTRCFNCPQYKYNPRFIYCYCFTKISQLLRPRILNSIGLFIVLAREGIVVFRNLGCL